MTDPDQNPTAAGKEYFGNTDWTVISAAQQPPSPESAVALEKLCQTYWYPIYAYVRRTGQTAEDAQDLTQTFFARLLAKNYLADVEPHKGKFRSFLLASLKHFLSDDWKRARAQKRGGGQSMLSLDADVSEAMYLHESAFEETPDRIFEKRWAKTVLEQATNRLRSEFVAAGKAEQFNQLKQFLESEPAEGDYAALAVRLHATSASIAMTVHRMRQRLRELLRVEITHTLLNPTELDEEMHYLLTVLS